ncbi:MAG: hypothetical protein Q8904_14135 [Bacteroidota bacterium]|nr:hypothetical protein [Bacteroidota bacterium]
MKSIKCTVFFLLLPFCLTLQAGVLNLKLRGDSASGFYVDVLYGTIPVCTREKSGELNMVVENEDHSIRENIKNWKATAAIQKGDSITLSGIVSLPLLETDLHITVVYEIINHQVVEKRMELLQTNMSMLYYSIDTSISLKASPSRFWSFDNANNKGGVANECYPAAGI